MSGFSSALMGVMGATATIGLAMASGYSLAPRYEAAQTRTRAVMVMSAVRQTGQAATMARMIDGDVGTGVEGARGLVSAGWLSALPRNPTAEGPAGAPALVRSGDGSSHVEMRLVGDDGSLCDQISLMAGAGPAPIAESPTSDPVGCVRTSRGSLAFSRG